MPAERRMARLLRRVVALFKVIYPKCEHSLIKAIERELARQNEKL